MDGRTSRLSLICVRRRSRPDHPPATSTTTRNLHRPQSRELRSRRTSRRSCRWVRTWSRWLHGRPRSAHHDTRRVKGDGLRAEIADADHQSQVPRLLCWIIKEVRLCTSMSCDNWPVRTGKTPGERRRQKSGANRPGRSPLNASANPPINVSGLMRTTTTIRTPRSRACRAHRPVATMVRLRFVLARAPAPSGMLGHGMQSAGELPMRLSGREPAQSHL